MNFDSAPRVATSTTPAATTVVVNFEQLYGLYSCYQTSPGGGWNTYNPLQTWQNYGGPGFFLTAC